MAQANATTADNSQDDLSTAELVPADEGETEDAETIFKSTEAEARRDWRNTRLIRLPAQMWNPGCAVIKGWDFAKAQLQASIASGLFGRTDQLTQGVCWENEARLTVMDRNAIETGQRR